jgi:hypothetical protein
VGKRCCCPRCEWARDTTRHVPAFRTWTHRRPAATTCPPRRRTLPPRAGVPLEASNPGSRNHYPLHARCTCTVALPGNRPLTLSSQSSDYHGNKLSMVLLEQEFIIRSILLISKLTAVKASGPGSNQAYEILIYIPM